VLALGLAHLLIEKQAFDVSFMREWTNGPLLVRSDSGRFLRQSDLQADGRPDVLYACAPDAGELLAYDATRGIWLDDNAHAQLRARIDVAIEHDPEKWEPVFGKRSCSNKKLERDDDSKKGHPALADSLVPCRTAFDIYAAAAAEYSPAQVAEITGVAQAALRKAAAILEAAPTIAYYVWNGVAQSVTATQTSRAISLLYALTGCYGARGGNVPDTAASFSDISGLDLISAEQRAKALGLTTRPLGPALYGWVTARDVYRAMIERQPYPVRMLFSFGTNLLSAHPDTATAQRALSGLEFHVHADFFINATARYADIVLPAATSWEREGLRTGFDANLRGMRRVQLRPAVVAPIGSSRSDTDIVLALAGRLGLADVFFGCDADRGHDAIVAPAGLTVAQLRATPGGIELDQSAVPLRAYAVADSGGAAKGFPDPDTPHRNLFGASLGARLSAGAGICGNGHPRRTRRIPPAPEQRENGRLLSQPAPQHCFLAPSCPRPDRGNSAGCRIGARHRGGRLGARSHARWSPRRAGKARRGTSPGYSIRPARLVDRWRGGQSLRRRSSSCRQP
jgi:anaerobic selenocysteine-containing dehydrogenase